MFYNSYTVHLNHILSISFQVHASSNIFILLLLPPEVKSMKSEYYSSKTTTGYFRASSPVLSLSPHFLSSLSRHLSTRSQMSLQQQCRAHVHIICLHVVGETQTEDMIICHLPSWRRPLSHLVHPL